MTEQHLQQFISEHQFPGKVIFAKVWGSRSHNTELPASDWDFSGVYVAPTKEVLGIHPPAETRDGKNPDYSFHEVRKFCDLLMKGNPGIIEMLWTERMCVETEEWLSLKKNRKAFLSKQAVEQYVGYAQGQLTRLLKNDGQAGLHTHGGKYSEKFAYHIVRLVGDALRIAQGGEPLIWKEGDEHDFLMRVRHNEYEWKFIADYMAGQLAIIAGMKPWSLPDNGDIALLEQWLLDVRCTSPVLSGGTYNWRHVLE